MHAHLKAAGFLLIAGFAGGFLVAQRTSAILYEQMATQRNGGGGDDSEEGGIKGAGKPGVQIAIESDDAGGAGGTFTPQDQAGGREMKARDGGDDDGNGQQPKLVIIKKKTSPSSDAAGDGDALAGAQAVSLLGGNSVEIDANARPPRFDYYATRGLMAETIDHGFRVTRWLQRDGQLCETNATGIVCKQVSVVMFRHPSMPNSASAKDTHASGPAIAHSRVIGQLLVDSAKLPIYAGNVMKFPAYIPVIDPPPAGALPGFEVVTADGDHRLAGGRAWKKIIGEPLSPSAGAAAGKQKPPTLFYDRDGLLFEVSNASSAGGMVALGKWTFRSNELCEDEPETGQPRPCLSPELTEGGLTNLVDSDGQRLSLAELPGIAPTESLGAPASAP